MNFHHSAGLVSNMTQDSVRKVLQTKRKVNKQESYNESSIAASIFYNHPTVKRTFIGATDH